MFRVTSVRWCKALPCSNCTVAAVTLAALCSAAALFPLTGCEHPGGGSGDLFWSIKPRVAAAELPPARKIDRPMRAMWVARFHYRYPDDIRTIIRNCKESGMNTVLWQVRGEATVAYPSQIEPWSREFDYRDPGFDPLALAVEEAHANGLRIEAWVNVMPGWYGNRPPGVRSHVHFTHPEWFLHDARGRRQALQDKAYVILNPCRPEVRQHIVALIDEMLSRYALDGIHLDYVRYAWESTPNADRMYPRDAETVALFTRETGKSPDDDPTVWRNWRINQLTRLVAEIETAVQRRRPGATLTAAVWRRPELGFNDYFQNAVAWLRTGIVDAIMPMAYTENLAQLESDIQGYRDLAPRGLIVPGLGIYKHERPDQIAAQLESCQARGGDFALFSYESLFPTASDRGSPTIPAKTQALRGMRREVLGDFSRR